MYLSDDIFNWPYCDHEGTGVDYEHMTRAHDIWRHAQNKLKNGTSEFDRVDCISSLKRAVNSRFKTINKVYSFDELPNLRSKKQALEKYQDYGIIRPAILKDLFEVRNLLEHEDIDPPPIEKCQYYIDIVWYFLKSTDSLLQIKCDCLIYENDDSELFIGPDKDWNITFNGQVNRNILSEKKQDGFLEILDVQVTDVQDDPQKVRISGRFEMTNDLRSRFARDYFGAVGFFYEDHT